jgi:tRNA threonylcarbamoyladenosine biosynthesis protein TsaB
VIVLGFDTATPATAVGLRLADGRVLEGRDDPPVGERPAHSTRLLALAHDLLRQAGLAWREIDRIAVGVGPGTFTGLRIGVASARGLAQSLGVELVGVSSLRALAHAAEERHERVLSVIDARRGEAFVAAYRAGKELAAPRPLPPQSLAESLDALGTDERAQEWVGLGDGALRFAAELRETGVEVPAEDSPLHLIRAAAVCELGAQASAADAAVLPSYCRAPDAIASRPGPVGVSLQADRSPIDAAALQEAAS